MKRVVSLAAFAQVVLLVAAADAHFMFVRITPPAEGGRSAEIYFSEYATAGDPRYIDKMAGGEFRLQTPQGFQPLAMRKLSDRLRAHVPASGTIAIVGHLDYGVLERPDATFLLRHYSKAVAGPAEEVNSLEPANAPLEIVAKFAGDHVVLTPRLAGKPMPNTKLDTVDADLAGEELKTDADGNVIFRPSHPGLFCVYVAHTDKTRGEHAGKGYQEIREFATLSFQWPLTSPGADDEAVALFEEALAARAAWQDFPGFTADIAGDVDGRPFSGTVKVAADGSVELSIDDDGLAASVEEQLASITMHRAASQTPSADRPKPVLRFADEAADHPLGRLLAFEGGSFATSYRVRDKQLTTVNRLIDGENMTITVLDNLKNADGKFLPHVYTVQYWDEKSGEPLRTENVRDEWTRVDRWDLPAGHTVSTASADGYSVRSFRLSKHALAK